MKSKKGFTLIELLAVIIILAIIALIAVPQVLKILYKSRLGAAEDSTYGVVNSAENYTGNLMIKNNGSYPNEDLYFLCNGSCKLQNELPKYNLEGLTELTFSGEKPTAGTVIIKKGGQEIIVKDLKINGFTCNYPVDEKVNCDKSNGEDGPLVIPTVQMNPSGWSQSKTGIINFSGTGQYLISPNANVSINVKATECSVIGNSVYICDGETIPAGSTLSGGSKWYEVTEMPTLTFIGNGTVQYKVVNGSDITETGTINVSQIDRTAPTAATFTTTQTTNSITVTASGTDAESGILRYQFSRDGGSTWLPSTPQTDPKYTFSSLSSGSYNIKVRVINGTYVNNGQNDMNTKASDTKSVTTGSLTVPTAKVNQSGWTQSKTVTITYTGSGAYLLRPSVAVTTNVAAVTCSSTNNGAYTCNGSTVAANGTLQANTWYKVTSNPTLTFTSNGSISMKVADGINYKDGSAVTVSQIDRTAPTAASFSTTTTSNSIVVTASGTDAESGILRYQFSRDGGSTWLPSTPQTDPKYTFSSLSSGSYNIKVRVINGTYGNNGQNDMNTKVSDTKSVTTGSLTAPVGKVNQSGWTQSKTVTITYTGSGAYLFRPSVAVTTNVAAVTCSSTNNGAYTCNGATVAANGTLQANTWYKVTSNPTLTFTSNGSISMKVADGTNYKDGSAVTVSQIDRTAPTTPTLTAVVGSISSYNTVSVAFTAASSDSGSGMNRYIFYNGSSQLGTVSTSANTASYTATNLPASAMNFKVTAYDNAGNSSTSTANYLEVCTAQSAQVCIGGKKATIYRCTNAAYGSSTRQYSVTTGTNC